ncbi:hypothetical protein ABE073_05045 [Lederbergia citrisecunda]|uniref:hypothetical protein n=1 Tax=Lederbergia citrisecunda TaxID=2833583 RepID=UPI003D290F7F
MEELKLSQLADDVEISNDGTLRIWTVEELKSEITQFRDEQTGQWFTVKRKKWQPCAQSMIEDYIDNQSDQMYEDWNERAMDCISDVLVENIQTLLDEAFNGDDATVYWEWDKPIEIDIFPITAVKD